MVPPHGKLQTEAVQLFVNATVPSLHDVVHVPPWAQLCDTPDCPWFIALFTVHRVAPDPAVPPVTQFLWHDPPASVYPPLQIYSHLAAVLAATSVMGVLATNPVLSPATRDALEGTVPVQE